MKKFIVLPIAVCLVATMLCGTGLAQQKIGFVDPHRIISKSKIGKLAQNDLSKLSKQKDKQIRESAKKINSIQKEISDGDLSPTQLRVKEDELQLLYDKHDELVEKAQIDLLRKEEELVNHIMRITEKHLNKIAKQNGYSMVLTNVQAEIIGYIDPSVDLTDTIIEELDKGQ